jgi:phosphohistidine phosphatase
MEVFLVRHGIAESEVAAMRSGRQDAERRLTPAGIKETQLVASALRERIGALGAIFHSPFERARETAEIFSASFPGARIEGASGFTPESDPRGLPGFLAGATGAGRIMIVSHEPFVSGALSVLLTGGFGLVCGFERSAVAGVEWGGVGASRLLFMASPRILLGERAT